MCKVIRDKLKAAQSRQKSYYDSKHRDLACEIGDHVYLRVSPMKGTRCFGIKGKLAPRYVGPFKIVSKRGDLAYQLELPSNFANVHDVFHVSQLRKCFKTPNRTINFEDIELQEDLFYHETPLLFSKRPNARLATSQSNFSKSSGHTIPTVKLPGNARITFVLNTRRSFSPRSRDEILS